MFYRRKILLALLESFGGSLKRTDCQKLLFLFCQRRGKNYYDFFPYKYGSFSFLLYQDKNRLTDLGLLDDQDIFQLSGHHSFSKDIFLKDRLVLQALVQEIGTLRGKNLIRKAYLECPSYASRSKIASEVLKQSEYEKISRMWNKDKTPCLFTMGYEGLSIDAYLNILLSNNVSAIVDVRKNPLSMKYGFSKTKFAYYAQNAGILYFHIPDLGISSNLRQDLKTPTAYQKLFEFYITQILPQQTNAIEELKAILHKQERIAITCFERDHQFCHRHKIVEYLEADPCFDIPVVHLNKIYTPDTKIMYTIDENIPGSLWD